MLDYEKHGINFIDEDHYKRFTILHQAANKILDSEYSSCFYLLSFNKDIFGKTRQCVSKDGIKVNSITRKAYSTSEEYIAKIAVALFNRLSDLKLDFYWVVKLDSQQYAGVLEAFRIRRGR